MIRALLYLRLTSLKNGLLATIIRLRQPKYAAGAVAALAYIYFNIIRPIGRPWRMAAFGGAAAHQPSPALSAADATIIGAAILLAVLFGRLALALVSPPESPGLRFSEAEIAFLFPAPLTRIKLVHFSLLSSQLAILISSLVLAVLLNRWPYLGGNPITHAVGWWMILSTIRLQSTATGLVVARGNDGGNGARGRLIALAAIGLIIGVAALSLWRPVAPPGPEDLSGPLLLIQYVARLLDAGLMHWTLLPFTCVVAPFMAPDLRSFSLALGPAVLVITALYFWVVRLEVPFQEGSITLANERARFRAARRSGGDAGDGSAKSRPRRDPFRIASRGRPELAFLWKNLIAIQSWFSPKVFFGLVACAAALVAANLRAVHGPHTQAAFAMLVLLGAAMLAFYTLLAGPQLLRQDLRNDLVNADILKTYPLPGWQIILGEMLTPIAILSGLLWFALLVASWALGRLGNVAPWLGPVERATLTGCIAALVPPLCALQLFIPNAAALLFPGWFHTTRGRGGGIEVMGQRLIFAVGQLFAIVIALLPAMITAGLLIFATLWLIGVALSAVVATAAVLAIVLGEVWCGLWWLGGRFDQLDLSTELPP